MKKNLTRAAALSTALIIGAVGAAYAKHEAIVLKNPAGAVITDGTAFSMKTTCFTSNCHNDGAPRAKVSVLDFNYNEIEAHNYHATVGANMQFGFNPYTPDGGAWRAGAGPMGKNWVQSPGHVGSW